jgi:hypothetical protein
MPPPKYLGEPARAEISGLRSRPDRPTARSHGALATVNRSLRPPPPARQVLEPPHGAEGHDSVVGLGEASFQPISPVIVPPAGTPAAGTQPLIASSVPPTEVTSGELVG